MAKPSGGPQFNAFVQLFTFKDDATKEGRVLSQVRIGDIYMSRLKIDPGVTTGNYYHKENRLMFYLERGQVVSACEHVMTKERKEMMLEPGRQIVHVPEYVAVAQRNIGKDEAILVLFSNYPIRRSEDCFDYEVFKV